MRLFPEPASFLSITSPPYLPYLALLLLFFHISPILELQTKNIGKELKALNMQKAYYCYRQHSYFGPFYCGKILRPITDKSIIKKYLSDPLQIELIEKYFPEGLSPHGLQILQSYKMDNALIEEPITEIVFELVRQLDFPWLPSRLSSLYASDTLEHAEQWNHFWIKALHGHSSQSAKSIWEINIKADTELKLHDASLLNTIPNNEFSYLKKLENAYRYWNCEITENPMPELLIPYPVVVTRLVREMNASEHNPL